MRKRRAALVGSASVAPVLFLHGPAWAGSDEYVETTDDSPGGGAFFHHESETVAACDLQSPDGHDVKAELRRRSDGHLYLRVVTDGDQVYCHERGDVDIPEGTTVRLKVCLYRGGSTTYFCDEEDAVA